VLEPQNAIMVCATERAAIMYCAQRLLTITPPHARSFACGNVYEHEGYASARGRARFFANAHKAHGLHGAPRFHPSPCHALAPVLRSDATRTRQHVPLRLLHRHCSRRGRAQTLSKPTWLQVGRALLGDDAAHAAAREPGVARGGRRGSGRADVRQRRRGE